jgi:spore germination protein
MENNKESKLTQSQFTFLIIGFLLGPGYIQLSRVIGEYSRQDAWISALIALVYPLYIISLSLYIIKKNPSENLLSINKKYYGKTFGLIINIIFLVQLITLQVTMLSDIARISLTYIIAFLNPIKVMIVVISIAFYGSFKGVKVLGKVNEYISYLSFSILLFSLYAVTNGELLNLMPVFGSGIKNIINGAVEASYYYYGFESILLLHTYLGDYKKIKRGSFSAFGITAVIWLWAIFICFFNLGADFVEKTLWPFVFVFESIHFSAVTNFLYIFMIPWSLVAIKSVSNFYFATSLIVNDLTKISINKIMIVLFPTFLYFGMLLLDVSNKKIVIQILFPAYVVFNILFYLTTALIIKFKNKTSKEC